MILDPERSIPGCCSALRRMPLLQLQHFSTVVLPPYPPRHPVNMLCSKPPVQACQPAPDCISRFHLCADMVSQAQNFSSRHTCSCPSSITVTQFTPISHALEPSLSAQRLGVTSTSPPRFSVEPYSSTHLVTGPKATDSDADTETDTHLSPRPTDHCPKTRLVHPRVDRICAHFNPWEPAQQ